MTALRSTFDPSTATITLELVLSEALPPDARLALTSIVQLTPHATSTARLVRRLASYHELAPFDHVPSGETWSVAALRLSHVPNHANDGPVSAFLIHPDETTSPVEVEPMRRVGAGVSDQRHERDADRSHGSPSKEANLVPYPVHLAVDDWTVAARSASLSAGPVAARAAWDAVASLSARNGRPKLAERGGARVTAELDDTLEHEAYRLTIEGESVTATAAGGHGFRHAFVTLAQWLSDGLPARAAVHDVPRHPYRGLHVDLARQWFEPEVVERLIDTAAWRKLSHLHLHLTDDEAWRVPIDGYPELAEIGGTRGHGLALPPMLGGGAERVGRAYTTDEIALWVARADSLGIVLVPEVDLPAHVHAALTAVPRLRDAGDRSGAISVQYYVDNVLVPGHPETMAFVEAVVDSVAMLFPNSPHLHIGGDEVPRDAWRKSPIVAELKSVLGLSSVTEVEAAFHRQLVTTVRERTGRRIGAWQEAAESGGVAPDDGYVIGWRTVEACRELAAAGFDVVVAPAQAYYLDIAVDDEWPTNGASWAGSTSLARVCEFDPEQGWSDAERDRLLGLQACLWTETVHDDRMLEQFLFPRLDAIAERAWLGRIQGGAWSVSQRAAAVGVRAAPTIDTQSSRMIGKTTSSA